jgi:predicted oxidoreductase
MNKLSESLKELAEHVAKMEKKVAAAEKLNEEKMEAALDASKRDEQRDNKHASSRRQLALYDAAQLRRRRITNRFRRIVAQREVLERSEGLHLIDSLDQRFHIRKPPTVDVFLSRSVRNDDQRFLCGVATDRAGAT